MRGAVKSFSRPACPEEFPRHEVRDCLPEALAPALGSIHETIGSLNERTREYDRELEAIPRESYLETALLRQVAGDGPVDRARLRAHAA